MPTITPGSPTRRPTTPDPALDPSTVRPPARDAQHRKPGLDDVLRPGPLRRRVPPGFAAPPRTRIAAALPPVPEPTFDADRPPGSRTPMPRRPADTALATELWYQISDHAGELATQAFARVDGVPAEQRHALDALRGGRFDPAEARARFADDVRRAVAAQGRSRTVLPDVRRRIDLAVSLSDHAVIDEAVFGGRSVVLPLLANRLAETDDGSAKQVLLSFRPTPKLDNQAPQQVAELWLAPAMLDALKRLNTRPHLDLTVAIDDFPTPPVRPVSLGPIEKSSKLHLDTLQPLLEARGSRITGLRLGGHTALHHVRKPALRFLRGGDQHLGEWLGRSQVERLHLHASPQADLSHLFASLPRLKVRELALTDGMQLAMLPAHLSDPACRLRTLHLGRSFHAGPVDFTPPGPGRPAWHRLSDWGMLQTALRRNLSLDTFRMTGQTFANEANLASVVDPAADAAIREPRSRLRTLDLSDSGFAARRQTASFASAALRPLARTPGKLRELILRGSAGIDTATVAELIRSQRFTRLDLSDSLMLGDEAEVRAALRAVPVAVRDGVTLAGARFLP